MSKPTRELSVDTTGSALQIAAAIPSVASQPSARDGRVLRRSPTDGVCSERVEFSTTPWWLWWNILSADAPTVAMVWALLYAYANSARLSTSDEIVLSLVVWAIYMSDRLLDGWTAKNRTLLQERHLFCARHRVALVCLVALASAAIVWLTAERLAPMEVSAGMRLGAIIGVYMAGVHAGRGWITGFVPKEVAVGVLFAAGTTLPVWSQSRGFSWDVWLSLALFALLCSLNCLSIECWENHVSEDAWQQTPHPFVSWANPRINRMAAVLAALGLMVFFMRHTKGSSGPEELAVSLAALLILLLNRRRNRLSRPALRVLADAALVVAGLIGLMTRV
jgi:hypothetical protein